MGFMLGGEWKYDDAIPSDARAFRVRRSQLRHWITHAAMPDRRATAVQGRASPLPSTRSL